MSTTLAQLRTRALEHADMVSSSFVGSGELDGYINASGGELWDVLIARYEDWFTTPTYTTFTLTGSQFQYALPADCVKLRGVDWSGTGGWEPLARYTIEDRRRWNNSSADSFLWAGELSGRRYTELGSWLSLVPETNAAGTYRFRYVQGWTTLTAAADSISLPNGWDEYIALDVAIKCLDKEESDTMSLQGRKAALLRRIEGASSNRDASEQDFICTPITHEWWW